MQKTVDPPASKPEDTLATLQTGHSTDPLLCTADEVGELPEGGEKVPCTLQLHFKSHEQAERFIETIATKLPKGLEPERIVFK